MTETLSGPTPVARPADVDGDIAATVADFGPSARALARGLLRFATAGSVDDGKSTLVGRLLHDSKSVLSDTLDAVTRTSQARGLDTPDLSLLVDGLRAEREQGITIDVAYRYFATPKRTFILADTPGHVQYTRNTVTGASTSDLVIILVDARAGVVAQTRRHAAVAALLGVPHLLLAVNKIDLVDFDEATFDRIAAEFDVYARDLGIGEVTAIPISALHGDNVVSRSARIGWYTGPSVLEHLENVDLSFGPTQEQLRFPVQYVIRPRTAEYPDYRGYAGRVAAGTVRPGDEVVILPSGRRSTVTAIDTADGPKDVAIRGESVTLLLADDVDLARGDLIAAVGGAPEPVLEFTVTVTQLADRPLRAGARVLLRYGAGLTQAMVTSIDNLLDIDTLAPAEHTPPALALNDIAQVTVRTAQPLPVEPFQPGGAVGALLIIDPADGTSLAAGMVGDRRAALHRRTFRPGAVQKDGSVADSAPDRCQPTNGSTQPTSSTTLTSSTTGTAADPRTASVASENFPTPGP